MPMPPTARARIPRGIYYMYLVRHMFRAFAPGMIDFVREEIHVAFPSIAFQKQD